jgi:hypothetical protein
MPGSIDKATGKSAATVDNMATKIYLEPDDDSDDEPRCTFPYVGPLTEDERKLGMLEKVALVDARRKDQANALANREGSNNLLCGTLLTPECAAVLSECAADSNQLFKLFLW